MTRFPNATFSDDGPVSLDLPMAGRAVVFTNGGSISFPKSAWPQALCALGLSEQPTIITKRARKPRKPTLVNVAKQASKAAIAVARYEVKPDGTVVVVTGKSESTEPNPWLADLKVTKQ